MAVGEKREVVVLIMTLIMILCGSKWVYHAMDIQ